MKKKLLSVFLCTVMTASLFGCVGGAGKTTTTPITQSENAGTTEAPTATSPGEGDNKETTEDFTHPTVEIDTSVVDKPIEKDPVVTATGTLVGAADFTTPFWGAHSDTWIVPAGTTVSATFINWHPAIASNWNNFVVVLQNMADVHSVETNVAYKEYGVVRSDNYGWKGTENTAEHLATLGWTLENNYNSDTFLADLQGATVKVSVTNNGKTADVVCDILTADGKDYQQKYLNIAVDGDLYFCLTVDGSCIDILKEAEVAETLVGATDCSTGWWEEFSDIYEVAKGKTVEVNFKNYSNKKNTWNNFIVVLQNVAQGHASAKDVHPDVNSNYKEYCIVRADNFGWNVFGDTDTNLAELGWKVENDYDWKNFITNIDGANVNVKVTNNKGKTADVVATVYGTDGNVYTQSYKNIVIDGPLFFTLGVDGAYLVME